VEDFSSFINCNWRGFKIDLQKNAAVHYLATSFLNLLCLNLGCKYKIGGSTEKIKNHQRSVHRYTYPYMPKKGPKKSCDTLPLKTVIVQVEKVFFKRIGYRNSVTIGQAIGSAFCHSTLVLLNSLP
jgi:hypothetical protein